MYKLILLSFFYFLNQDPSSWQVYTDPDSLFSILTPGEVQSKEQLITTETGDNVINSVFYTSSVDSTDNFIYLINYQKLTEDLYLDDSLDVNYEVLDLFVQDIGANLNADLLYVNKSFQHEYPALEYRMQYGESLNQVKGKLILTRTHLYSIQVYTTKQYSLNKNMEKFFNSFFLLDQSKN
jgi:hypothetical protein